MLWRTCFVCSAAVMLLGSRTSEAVGPAGPAVVGNLTGTEIAIQGLLWSGGIRRIVSRNCGWISRFRQLVDDRQSRT